MSLTGKAILRSGQPWPRHSQTSHLNTINKMPNYRLDGWDCTQQITALIIRGFAATSGETVIGKPILSNANADRVRDCSIST